MNKKRVSFIVFIIGIITLICGVIFLIVKLTAQPMVHDAEYLVSIGQWAKKDEPSVVWNFTEIGKGELTTNNHLNDYDFTWSIEDENLIINTDWLYELNNEFKYELNRSNNTLTLDNGSETVEFLPVLEDQN